VWEVTAEVDRVIDYFSTLTAIGAGVMTWSLVIIFGILVAWNTRNDTSSIAAVLAGWIPALAVGASVPDRVNRSARRRWLSEFNDRFPSSRDADRP
jgi:hypothetical protein